MPSIIAGNPSTRKLKHRTGGCKTLALKEGGRIKKPNPLAVIALSIPLAAMSLRHPAPQLNNKVEVPKVPIVQAKAIAPQPVPAVPKEQTARVETAVQQQPAPAPAPIAAERPPISKEELMTAAGIPENEWAAVDFIVSKESDWCHTKWQGQIGFCPESYQEKYDPSTPSIGYGFCQSTPAIKMASAGSDWRTNPVTQLKWCSMHAKSHHGSWWAGFAYWQAHRNW